MKKNGNKIFLASFFVLYYYYFFFHICLSLLSLLLLLFFFLQGVVTKLKLPDLTGTRGNTCYWYRNVCVFLYGVLFHRGLSKSRWRGENVIRKNVPCVKTGHKALISWRHFFTAELPYKAVAFHLRFGEEVFLVRERMPVVVLRHGVHWPQLSIHHIQEKIAI